MTEFGLDIPKVTFGDIVQSQENTFQRVTDIIAEDAAPLKSRFEGNYYHPLAEVIDLDNLIFVAGSCDDIELFWEIVKHQVEPDVPYTKLQAYDTAYTLFR